MMRQVIAAAMAYPGLPAPWLLQQPETILATISSIQDEWKD